MTLLITGFAACIVTCLTVSVGATATTCALMTPVACTNTAGVGDGRSEKTHRWVKDSAAVDTTDTDANKAKKCCKKTCQGAVQAGSTTNSLKCADNTCIANYKTITIKTTPSTEYGCEACPSGETKAAGAGTACNKLCGEKGSNDNCDVQDKGDAAWAWKPDARYLTSVDANGKKTACRGTDRCKNSPQTCTGTGAAKRCKCDAQGCKKDQTFASSTGTCTDCPVGEYSAAGTGTTCSKCHASCATCDGANGADKCFRCAAMYFKAGGKTDTEAGTCTKCHADCATCNAAGNSACLTCADKKFPTVARTTSAPAGGCSACSDTCKKCTKADKCSECADAHFGDGTTPNIVCKKCHSSCKTCTAAAANKCTACKTGKLSDGKCSSMAVTLNPVHSLAGLAMMLAVLMSQ